LAKNTGRYGERLESAKASLVQVEQLEEGTARIKILDAIGMVAVEGLQLTVVPKIPRDHFLEIAGRSPQFPRMATLPGALESEERFAVLVCHWFMVCLERILAEGLVRDYREVERETEMIRGQLEPLETARLFYRGRLAVAARFEEFDQDNALNRILLEAAKTIARAPALPGHLRRRALRALAQMPGIGILTRPDLSVWVDRNNAHYGDGILLAKEVIAASGRALSKGQGAAWTFLYRTAIPIEEGIRAILTESLEPIPVHNRSFPLGDSSLRVNPDLVFGGVSAVGDVKYKLDRVKWDRGDLYQVVAFAAAAEAKMAILVDFKKDTAPACPPVRFGDIEVRNAFWRTGTGVSVESAKASLLAEVMAVLDEKGLVGTTA
jgi:5-methylcytosine-specific restriction endonuclease McrBC regulatory subunit McrC